MKNILPHRMTLILITIIVLMQLIISGGENASTSWLFISYGIFYISRIILFYVGDGTLKQFLKD